MKDSKIDLIIHFVSNPLESAIFYQKILERQPIEQAPTFVLFDLSNGTRLGLWSSKTAEPSVGSKPGSSEICLKEDNVDEVYKNWRDLGIPMAQDVTDMDFGRTFVALDPDGHRIRVYKLNEEN